MSSSEKRAPSSASQGPPIPPADVASARARTWRRLALVAPLVVIAALVVAKARKADPGLHVVATGAALGPDGRFEAPASAGAALRVSDGSEVKLAPGAVARLVATATLGGRVALERGRLEARVAAPNPIARWFFELGPFELTTPGGVVELVVAGANVGAGRFELALREGQALLRGPLTGGGLPLRSDERVLIDLGLGTLARLPASAGARGPELRPAARAVVEASAAGAAATPFALPSAFAALAVAEDGLVLAIGVARDADRPAEGLLLRAESGALEGRLAGVGQPADPRLAAAAAADATHLFAAVTLAHRPGVSGDAPPKGKRWAAIRRFDRAGRPAPFSGGRGPDGSLFVVGEGVEVTALARGGGLLFVGARDEQRRRSSGAARGRGWLVTFDVGTGAERARVGLSTPLALTADARGDVWAADEDRITRLPRDGAAAETWADARARPRAAGLARAIEPVDLAGRARAASEPTDPAGLARAVSERADPAVRARGAADALLHPVALARAAGGRLIVADSAGALFAIDAPGAPPAPLGAVALARGAVRGLGVDRTGAVIVASNLGPDGGARLEAFGPDGALLWSRAAHLGAGAAAVDLASAAGPLDLYTALGRFRLGDEGAAFVAPTLDPARFPDDPRLAPDAAVAPALVRVAGARLLVDGGTPSKIRLFRFEGESALAIPAVTFGFGPAPALPEAHPARRAAAWLWRDADGDGRPRPDEYEGFELPYSWASAVEPDGTLWRATASDGIDRFPCEGLDERGVPRYRLAAAERLAPPAEIERLQRLELGRGGVLFVAGSTKTRPNPYKQEAWRAIGTELLRYDDFRGARRLRWRRPLLVDASFARRAVAFTAAGRFVFVARAHEPALEVLDAETGTTRGHLPILEGAALYDPALVAAPLRAFERPDGEVVVIAADPARGRLVVIRLRD